MFCATTCHPALVSQAWEGTDSWPHVASVFSATTSGPHRTAAECEERWHSFHASSRLDAGGFGTDGQAAAASAKPSRKGILVAYFISFIALGCTSSMMGPTLLDLAERMSIGLKEMSIVYAVHSLGYPLGSALGGQLVDKRPSWGHAGLVAVSLLNTAVSGVFPYAGGYVGILLLSMMQGTLMGAIDNIVNVRLVRMMSDNLNAPLQALHAAFAVGTVLGPLLARPYVGHDGQLVHIPWLALAGLTAFSALVLIALPCYSPWHRAAAAQAAASSKSSDGDAVAAAEGGKTAVPVPPGGHALIASVCFFLLAYTGLEFVFGGYIYTYAVKSSLQLKPVVASEVNALFWGMLTVGRVLAVPVSARLRPATLLAIDLAACAAAGLLMVIDILQPGWFGGSLLLRIWLPAGLLGLGVSTVYPTIVTLVAERMEVKGAVVTAFIVAASIGMVAMPVAVGHAMDERPQALFAATAACAGCCLLLSCAVIMLARRLPLITAADGDTSPLSSPSSKDTELTSLRGAGEGLV
eukprot:PLAT12015.2.p1 GENE.PLAT12015.2~~PLAT12015.2.p1  ORF type:complete len:523 (-),score=151.62 PLAT12015.2:56-1624(-)